MCVFVLSLSSACLPELHENVHHAHEVASLQRCTRGRPRHELLVKGRLSPAELAHHHVLVLSGELFLNVLSFSSFFRTPDKRCEGVLHMYQHVGRVAHGYRQLQSCAFCVCTCLNHRRVDRNAIHMNIGSYNSTIC